uniref:Uncharacterized protein n=1 Tax=Oncorhynchus kisutch TaxID=8019 RepID=A0A8C7F6S8_ONCKI
LQIPWRPHHQQTNMAQAHQDSCEEGTRGQNLFPLRRLKRFGMGPQILKRAVIPLEPMLCKKPIMSVHLGCSKEMLTVVSMLPVQNQALADQKKATFHQAEGSHLTLLNVYSSWMEEQVHQPFVLRELYPDSLLANRCWASWTVVSSQNAAKKELWEGYCTLIDQQVVCCRQCIKQKMQQCLEPLYNRYEEK